MECPSIPPCFKAVLMLHLKRFMFRKASVSLSTSVKVALADVKVCV